MTNDNAVNPHAVFADLIGRYVEVRTIEDNCVYTDEGILVACEHPWIRLHKDNGDVLCFPASHIRLVKVIE